MHACFTLNSLPIQFPSKTFMVLYLKLKQVQNSLKRQAFASFQHGFLRSAENIDLHNLGAVVWENVHLHNITNTVHVLM